MIKVTPSCMITVGALPCGVCPTTTNFTPYCFKYSTMLSGKGRGMLCSVKYLEIQSREKGEKERGREISPEGRDEERAYRAPLGPACSR